MILEGRAADPLVVSGRAMGTTWSVKIASPAGSLDAAGISAAVAARLEQLEQQFSTYREQSELSRFNARRSTAWQAVSPELAAVARESRRISEVTSGAFDVTVEPLVRLWGFGSAGRAAGVPSAADISAARACVDWRQLEFRAEPAMLRKAQAGLSVDFSSMAKGFAADAVSQLLTALGVPNHFVQIGGDVKAAGANAAGQPWRAGIEEPGEDSGRIVHVVQLADRALSTSGDYRNFFRAAGRRYGHIIDPRTGEPVTGPLAAVSVVHRSGATSSALATALFVLGAERGLDLATREGWACVFFVRQGPQLVIRATPKFAPLLAAE